MRIMNWNEIQAEPDATVFAAISPAGDEGCLRLKMPGADDWGDEYAGWTFKVYEEHDCCNLAELLLDPAKAMKVIRDGMQGEEV